MAHAWSDVKRTTESLSSFMQVLHSRAVHVAMHARAAIMQELDWQSGSKTQAKPCKKRCWNIDSSGKGSRITSSSFRFDRFIHDDSFSNVSSRTTLTTARAHENILVSVEFRILCV